MARIVKRNKKFCTTNLMVIVCDGGIVEWMIHKIRTSILNFTNQNEVTLKIRIYILDIVEEKYDSKTIEEEGEYTNLFAITNQQVSNLRDRQRNQLYSQDIGMEIENTKFDGKVHPNYFIDLLNTMKSLFNVKEYVVLNGVEPLTLPKTPSLKKGLKIQEPPLLLPN